MKQSGDGVQKRLLLYVHEVCVFVAARNSIAEFIDYMLNACESRIPCVLDRLHWLSWCSWLGWNGLLAVVFTVDKSMAGSSSFNFAQADQIASLEVSVPMLKLPHGLFRTAIMEDIAYWTYCQIQALKDKGTALHTFVKAVHIQLANER